MSYKHPNNLSSTNEALTTDYEITNSSSLSQSSTARRRYWWNGPKYLGLGFILGVVFVKSEVVSWFRIQEMFRLQSFHMYGVMGTAVATGMLSVWLIKKLKIKTIVGETIIFPKKTFNKGQVFGGLIFGFGWAMTGACPGPLFAQIGTGALVICIVMLSAIAGTWVYGYIREKLPV